jgi:hypothetical protein
MLVVVDGATQVWEELQSWEGGQPPHVPPQPSPPHVFPVQSAVQLEVPASGAVPEPVEPPPEEAEDDAALPDAALLEVPPMDDEAPDPPALEEPAV